MLEILEEPISEKSINEIINCQNITDMGMTSLNMVMFIVELENKYDCKIDIMGLCTRLRLVCKRKMSEWCCGVCVFSVEYRDCVRISNLILVGGAVALPAS
ncbi:acyl carrier protein [Hoylesella nanceiensis]|uniref:acyl carrier protein n=1 Tax=Hoylesella nanceiensis TaxID=425941 RepID=UPI003AF50E0E